jgi:hypothetical protein
MTDKKKILQLLLATAEVLRGELSEPAQEMYLSVLMQYDEDQITKALNECVRECRFFPVPADIIERIEGSKKVHAVAAWDNVLSLVRSRGRNYSGGFDHQTESALRVIGGWKNLCDTEEKVLSFKMKDFCEAYGTVGHHAFDDRRILGDLNRKALECADNEDEACEIGGRVLV